MIWFKSWYTMSKQTTNDKTALKSHKNMQPSCIQQQRTAINCAQACISNLCCHNQETSTWHAFEAQQRVCQSNDVTVLGCSCVYKFYMWHGCLLPSKSTYVTELHTTQHPSAQRWKWTDLHVYRGWVCHIHFHYIKQQALTPVYYCFRSQYARVQLCEVWLVKQTQDIKAG